MSTLDLIGHTLRYVKERHGIDLDLAKIPLDDEKVLRAFAQGKTTGIFQFESGGMRRLLKEIASTGAFSLARQRSPACRSWNRSPDVSLI